MLANAAVLRPHQKGGAGASHLDAAYNHTGVYMFACRRNRPGLQPLRAIVAVVQAKHRQQLQQHQQPQKQTTKRQPGAGAICINSEDKIPADNAEALPLSALEDDAPAAAATSRQLEQQHQAQQQQTQRQTGPPGTGAIYINGEDQLSADNASSVSLSGAACNASAVEGNGERHVQQRQQHQQHGSRPVRINCEDATARDAAMYPSHEQSAYASLSVVHVSQGRPLLGRPLTI